MANVTVPTFTLLFKWLRNMRLVEKIEKPHCCATADVSVGVPMSIYPFCVAFAFVLWWWSILTGGMLLAVRIEWSSWLIQVRSDLDRHLKVITLLKQIKLCAVNTCFNYRMFGTRSPFETQTCMSNNKHAPLFLFVQHGHPDPIMTIHASLYLFI